MQLGIEWLTLGVHRLHLKLAQYVEEVLQSQLDPFAQGGVLLVSRLERRQAAFKIVHHRQQLADKALEGKLVGVLDIALGASTQVLHLGLGAQYGVPGLSQFALQLFAGRHRFTAFTLLRGALFLTGVSGALIRSSFGTLFLAQSGVFW